MIFRRKGKNKIVEERLPETVSTWEWPTSTEVWNMCEYVTRTGYDFSSRVVDWIYKQIFDPQPPGGTVEWDAWNDRKIAERKKAQFEALLNERKKKLNAQSKIDHEIINDKKSRCTDWYSESKKQLREKYSYDENVYVPEQDWNNPSRTTGWETEQFDHTPNNQKLCERLNCDSNSKLKLPDTSSSSKNTCRQEQLQIRDLERQMARTDQQCERNLDYLTESYEKAISDLTARCYTEGSESKSRLNRLELPGPPTVPNLETVQKLAGATGFWSILNFPVNVARGNIFQLSKDQGFLAGPICRLFEVLIAVFIVIAYGMIAILVWNILSFVFAFAKESVEHWKDNRRRDSEYLFDQRRREDNAKRRRKRRREFGQGLNEVLDGPAKKTASLVKAFRGGYQPSFDNLTLPKIPFNALKMDPAEFTQWEKEQILFACDPIHSMIQIEKLRLEVREILESCQPSDLYKPRSSKIKKIFKSFSTPFKRISFPSLKVKRVYFRSLIDKVSLGLGILTMSAAAVLLDVPSSDPNINSRVSQYPSYQIEQINARYPGLTNTFTSESSGPDFKQLEKLVETEELLELEAAVENEQAEPKKPKRRKIKKHNRKIHTLNDLKKEQGEIKAVYSVREDSDGQINVTRVEGDNIEELIIDKSKSDKYKAK